MLYAAWLHNGSTWNTRTLALEKNSLQNVFAWQNPWDSKCYSGKKTQHVVSRKSKIALFLDVVFIVKHVLK